MIPRQTPQPQNIVIFWGMMCFLYLHWYLQILVLDIIEVYWSRDLDPWVHWYVFADDDDDDDEAEILIPQFIDMSLPLPGIDAGIVASSPMVEEELVTPPTALRSVQRYGNFKRVMYVRSYTDLSEKGGSPEWSQVWGKDEEPGEGEMRVLIRGGGIKGKGPHGEFVMGSVKALQVAFEYIRTLARDGQKPAGEQRNEKPQASTHTPQTSPSSELNGWFVRCRNCSAKPHLFLKILSVSYVPPKMCNRMENVPNRKSLRYRIAVCAVMVGAKEPKIWMQSAKMGSLAKYLIADCNLSKNGQYWKRLVCTLSGQICRHLAQNGRIWS